MSKIKIAQIAGMKLADVVKKLKKRKYRKDTKKNIERARGVRMTKSVKAYNIRAKDAETKIIPVKKQSQKGSSFQTHRVRSRKGRMAAGLTRSDRMPSPLPTLERLYKGDVQRGTRKDYGLTRMYLRNRLSDVKKKKKGGIMKRKMYLSGGQAKLDKNKNNRLDAEDFKILRAEKAKGRGMGLQDEKLKPGKVKKAALGALALGFGAKKIFDKIKGKKKSVKMPGMSGIMPGETVADLYKKKMKGMMGGGMMMKPMGYKSGKSVKVKCKLGRNKPTKMY